MARKNKNRNGSDFWLYARSFLHVYLPKVRNLSQNTIDSYKQSMTYFIDYLKNQLGIERQDVTFDCLSRKNIKNYLVRMNEVQNLAIKTCNLRLTALKSFIVYIIPLNKFVFLQTFMLKASYINA
jgi:site-specific recombinase XerD